MNSPRLLPAKPVVVGLVAASVLAAGLTLGIEHAVTGSTIQLSSAAASPAPSLGEKPAFGRGGLGGEYAGAVIGVFTKDTGLSALQVLADIKNGQTLDQIAGAKDATVKADYLAAITTGLDQAVAKGVITKDSEQHLLADARDAIDQLFAAKLSAAGLGSGLGMGIPGLGGPGFGHPGARHPFPGASPSASASPSTSGV